MSESPAETDAGATEEVADTSASGATTGEDTAAEDQAAEEALHTLMQEEDPDELKKQLEHWRRTAQRHEKTARDNSAAAKKLRELEDAGKSELEKAVSARDAAVAERDAMLLERTRVTAAAAHGLDPDFAEFLGGNNEDDINASAETLAGLIKIAAEKLVGQSHQSNGGRPPATRGRPVESMRPGATPAGNVAASADDMFRQLLTGDR